MRQPSNSRQPPLHSGESGNQPRILLLGPSLSQNGGMATVQSLIVAKASLLAQIKHISTHSEGSELHRIIVFARALLIYIWMLWVGWPDLVHMHFSERGSVFRAILFVGIAKVLGTPVVVHAHGCEFHTFFEKLPAIGQKLVGFGLSLADGCIMLSDSWKRYYISRCHLDPAKVVVLSNPTEVPESVPTRQASQVRFAFLGRVGQRKGAFDLISAFAQLPESLRQNASLTLAGDGSIGEAKEMAKDLGIANDVRFLGWINPAQRNQLLEASDVFVLPSYNEGLPMAMLEAMSWALPVISTPVGGIPELIDDGHTGCLVEPGDISGLRRAMEKLIQSPALRLEMGQKAREKVLPLDVSHYCEALVDVYALVIAAKVGSPMALSGVDFFRQTD